MFKEILNLKFKLYLRNEYDQYLIKKIKINYLFIFIPFYLFLLFNIHVANNFFYAACCFFLINLGLDFHAISNKSNLNCILLFNQLLTKRKSILLNLLADFVIKFTLLTPIFFFIKEYFMLAILSTIFIILSFFLKELVGNNTINIKIYFIFIFIYLFFFSLLGGLFLDFTTKNITYLNYSSNHFFDIYIIATLAHFFIAFFLFLVYLDRFHKTAKCE